MTEEEKTFTIENTKELLTAVLELGNAFGVSLEDGKISLGDLTNFIGAAQAMPAAIGGMGEIKKELGDLDEAEKAELLAHAVDTFDIPQEKVEALVEVSLKAGFMILDIIAMFRETKNS